MRFDAATLEGVVMRAEQLSHSQTHSENQTETHASSTSQSSLMTVRSLMKLLVVSTTS